MTGREILSHAGAVNHGEALARAQAEYDKYRQKHLNDPSPVERHFIEAVEQAKRLEPGLFINRGVRGGRRDTTYCGSRRCAACEHPGLSPPIHPTGEDAVRS